MSDTKKDKKNDTENQNITSDKDKKVTEKKEKINKKNKNENINKDEVMHKRIKKFGNFLLTVIVTLIVGTGALAYYLIYTSNPNGNGIGTLVGEMQNTVSNQVDNVENTVSLGNIIDSAVSTVTNTNSSSSNTTATNTVTSSDANSRKISNENLVVLYDGLLLDTSKMGQVELKYIYNSSTDKEKYVITYFSYANFKFKDSDLGTLSSQIYDGLIKIDNVGKVAISEDYNAIPRNIKVVNSIPTIVADNNPKLTSYDLKKAIIVDLDGNGTDEYILVLGNTSTGYSKITLVDSKGIKVADLAYIEKSKWESVSTEEYHLSINNIEVLDVDNDGIMEILVEIPKYEGEPDLSLLKYKNGELTGKTNIECSLLP